MTTALTAAPPDNLAEDLPYFTPPPTDLPYDDGEPLDSKRHRIAMNVLIRSLDQGWADRDDYFAGGNMFIYYSAAQAWQPPKFRGPDFFVVLGVANAGPRKTWTVWEEDGHYPDVIVELLSPTTRTVDLGPKKTLYEQLFRTKDYYVFDPYNPASLQGWHLGNSRYQPLMPDARGWLWCESLGLWLGTWEGVIDREPAVWLRFYDAAGNLVPLPEEAARQQAAVAQREAEAAQREAEAAQREAEAAQREAAMAQEQVARERERAERLTARLRALGIEPDAP